MKKIFLALVFFTTACSYFYERETFNPDYNKYMQHVSIVNTTSDAVVYEYKDIRIDELGALAAQYCDEHGMRQAYLDKILLHKNHARRAVFICREN